MRAGRVYPPRIRVNAEFHGKKAKLVLHKPLEQERVIFNLDDYNRDVVRYQAQDNRAFEVGVMTGPFHFLHAMHVVMAAQTLAEGRSETIIFLPKQRVNILQPLLLNFSFSFAVSNLRADMPEVEAVALLKNMNDQTLINFNWISSSAGKSGQRIYRALRDGHDLDEAIDRAISPHLWKYTYYYFADEAQSDVVKILSAQEETCRLQLVRLPDEFLPFRNPHYTIMEDGRTVRNFMTSNWKTDIYFPIPYSQEVH
ncbi:hypothetical protein ACFL37_02450 [Candidatus Margulisiibacteriota bacterium]